MIVDTALEARGLAERTTDRSDRHRTVIAYTGSLPPQLVDALHTVREPIAQAIAKLTRINSTESAPTSQRRPPHTWKLHAPSPRDLTKQPDLRSQIHALAGDQQRAARPQPTSSMLAANQTKLVVMADRICELERENRGLRGENAALRGEILELRRSVNCRNRT